MVCFQSVYKIGRKGSKTGIVACPARMFKLLIWAAVPVHSPMIANQSSSQSGPVGWRNS